MMKLGFIILAISMIIWSSSAFFSGSIAMFFQLLGVGLKGLGLGILFCVFQEKEEKD